MDKKRLRQLAGLSSLNERTSESLQKIAEDVYSLAESRVADKATDQQGYGFDRNAILAEAERIFIEVKAHIEYKLKNNKF
jgi:hypothetical protein